MDTNNAQPVSGRNQKPALPLATTQSPLAPQNHSRHAVAGGSDGHPRASPIFCVWVSSGGGGGARDLHPLKHFRASRLGGCGLHCRLPGGGGGVRNRRNLEWQNLAQQNCAKLCHGISASEAIFQVSLFFSALGVHIPIVPAHFALCNMSVGAFVASNFAERGCRGCQEIIATNQRPMGNINHYSRCILVLVPQSGNLVPNFAAVFPNWGPFFSAPNFAIPYFARSSSPPPPRYGVLQRIVESQFQRPEQCSTSRTLLPQDNNKELFGICRAGCGTCCWKAACPPQEPFSHMRPLPNRRTHGADHSLVGKIP